MICSLGFSSIIPKYISLHSFLFSSIFSHRIFFLPPLLLPFYILDFASAPAGAYSCVARDNTLGFLASLARFAVRPSSVVPGILSIAPSPYQAVSSGDASLETDIGLGLLSIYFYLFWAASWLLVLVCSLYTRSRSDHHTSTGTES